MFRRRKNLRLSDFDYSTSGYYFVTICTENKVRILTSIVSGRSVLTPEGVLVDRHWRKLKNHFPGLILDAFVVMPDHFHGILKIPEPPDGHQRYSLTTVIQNFKSITSRKVGRNKLWQRNYYEHVIRNERSLNLIRLYIDLNPRLWEDGRDLNEVDLSFAEIEKILAKYPEVNVW